MQIEHEHHTERQQLESISASPSGVKRRRGRRAFQICGFLLIAGLGAWGARAGLLAYWSRQCAAAQSEQRWLDLEETARRWSRWDPQSADAWLYWADAAQHQQRFMEAAELLARVPSDSEKAIPALQARVRILCGPANRPLEGEVACRELLAREPRATLAHQSLIQFYALSLQRHKLREQIREAIRNDRESPEAYIYYFLGDTLRLADGVSMNGRWLATYPDHEVFVVASLLHGEGVALPDDPAASDDPEQDAAVLSEKEHEARQLLKRFPHNSNLLAYVIEQEVSKGREEAVLQLFRQIPKAAEAEGRFWSFKGWAESVRGDDVQAEQDYRRALSLAPMDWTALNRLADVLRSRQEDPQEIERLQNLVRRAQDLRSQIRELESVEQVPHAVLRHLGRLARDCGDDLIAAALTRRLGSLEETRSTGRKTSHRGAVRPGFPS